MENLHATREGSLGDYYLPGYLGSNEIDRHSHAVRILDDHQQSWSPLCLSSPSASTEYWSNDTSPYTRLNDLEWPGEDSVTGQRSQSVKTYDAPLFAPTYIPCAEPVEDLPNNAETSTWCEKLAWSEPPPLDCNNLSTQDDCVIHDLCSEHTPESPGEQVCTLSQEQVDRNIVEMTCGPRLEEEFWPIRYQIRHGKFHAYENAIHALIVHARKELQPSILSKLTSELASLRVGCGSSLTSFLDESRGHYERLCRIASEIGARDLQRFKEAIWEDNLLIILVFYEMLTSKADLDDIMQLRGNKAQFILDLMQDAIRTHIDFVYILRGGTPRMRGARRNFLNHILNLGFLRNVDRVSAQLDARRLIVKLSEVCDLLPSSLAIHGVEHRTVNPVFGGTFGDIFGAQYEGNFVALKRLRFFQTESVETRRRFCREALIWKNLDHHYVLPFLGVDSESFPGFLCMVSPWMGKGPIVKASGGPDKTSIPVLMYEIAMGLQYLHSQNIIHGDLRGANILLDDQGHVRLADFGLTVFADGPLAPTTRGGSTRWMAPELLDPNSCGLELFQRTFASDIYAFACVCLELYTGKPPFSEISSEGAVLLKVIRGERPECPPVVPEWCSQFIVKCWSHNPVNRPGTGNVIESIVKAVRKRPRPAVRQYSSSAVSEGSPFKRLRFQHVIS
ncbi:kinase-like domain-containing protein [Mycena epipterygia]|nr:kinase-like domain-containing protein [Mycena epipterygia]